MSYKYACIIRHHAVQCTRQSCNKGKVGKTLEKKLKGMVTQILQVKYFIAMSVFHIEAQQKSTHKQEVPKKLFVS